MELTPRDLGNERYISLLRRRLTPVTSPYATTTQSADFQVTPSPPRPRGRITSRRLRRRMREYWVRDLNLDEETSEQVADIVSRGTPGVNMKVGMIIASVYLFMGAFFTMIGVFKGAIPPLIPFLFLLAWFMVLIGVTSSPRRTLKVIHDKALSVAEVESLLPTVRGRLERTYLNLVLDAMRLDIPSESAQSNIRAALRHLGDAISRLPADPVSTEDAATLRTEAHDLRQQALLEHDSVVQGSLNRQAEALERRAAIAAQNNRSARRAAALRREARTQMDSLRAVLVAYSQIGANDMVGAGQLSEAVQRVSTEVQALALAQHELEHEELEHLYGAPLPAEQPIQQAAPVVPQAAPVQQIVQSANVNGNGHTPSAAQPEASPQSSRQWWRSGGNV